MSDKFMCLCFVPKNFSGKYVYDDDDDNLSWATYAFFSSFSCCCVRCVVIHRNHHVEKNFSSVHRSCLFITFIRYLLFTSCVEIKATCNDCLNRLNRNSTCYQYLIGKSALKKEALKYFLHVVVVIIIVYTKFLCCHLPI